MRLVERQPRSRRSTSPRSRCAPTRVVVPVSSGTVCVQANVGVRRGDRHHRILRQLGRLQLPAAVARSHVRQPAAAVRPQPGHRRAAAGSRTGRATPHRRPPGCAGQSPRRHRSTSRASRSAPTRTSPPIRAGRVPLASNLNITPWQGVTANGAMIKLSNDGDLCVYSPNAVHVVSTSTASGSDRPATLRRPESAVELGVDDARPVAHGVDTVARQDPTSTEHPATPPSSTAQLGRPERVLSVDPTREPVADERGVDGGEEPLVLVDGLADQRGDEVRAQPSCAGRPPRRPSRRRAGRPPASAPTPTRGRVARPRSE